MLRRLVPALLGALLVAPAAHAAGDPLAAHQYALTQLHATQAWSVSQGRGIVVAVVDTGVDLRHPDFRGRLVPGATFLGCGPRPCGNGDWRSGPASRRGESFGHGTAVAGLVVAGRGNGVGIIGVAPLAKVMPVKVLDRTFVTKEDIANGIRWAAAHGADVINISLAIKEPEVVDAVTHAIARGAVVAAAGNETDPTCLYPAAVPEVVCVTATDRNEAPAIYSDGAVKEGMRTVAAPGGMGVPSEAATLPFPDCTERVLSAWPVGDTGNGRCPAEGGYRYLTGTSLAAPEVAGVVALLLAQGRTPAQAVDVLLKTARTPGVGPGMWTPQYGYGIADAAAAVRA